MSEPARHDGERRSVLFLHPTAEYNGADRSLLQVLRALDRDRWAPVVALPRRGPLIGALEDLGVKVEIGSLGVVGGEFGRSRGLRALLTLPLTLFFVWRMIRRHKAAVVHTHTIQVIGGAAAARLFAPRHIWHVHRTLKPNGLRAKLLARAIHHFSEIVACGSKSAQDALELQCPGVAEKTRLVRSAIDKPLLLPSPEKRTAVRENLGVFEESTLLLVVGRIEPGGGQRDVLEAIKSLRYTHPDVRAVFVGDPGRGSKDYVNAIDAEIKGGALDGVVSRIPYRRDLSELYAAADVVCLPGADPDPFQIVVLEAMAAERPVIAAGGAGVAEYIATGKSGLVFDAGDIERLAWCIGSLSADPNRRAQMGEECVRLHEAEFQSGRLRNEFDRAWSRAAAREFTLPAQRATIVHVVLGKANPERLNGVNYVVHNLATTQHRMGLDVTLFGLTKEPASETLEREYKTRYFGRLWRRFGTTPELRTAIDQLDTTSIVHLHGAHLPEMWSIARRLRKRRIPYAVTPHGAYSLEARKHRALLKRISIGLFERRFLNGARGVQVLSGRELVETEGVCNIEQLRVVPNGQEAIAWPSVAPAIAADAKRPVFCFCGRMVAHTKGLDALLSGFARYVARRGTGTLWLIGDGRDRAALETQASELGISRRLEFLGARFGDEKHALVAACDAFVHPSRHEGMPTSVLEAGALHRPLVVTPGTNLDREVRKAQAGFVIPEVTPEAIADALMDVERERERGYLQTRGQNAAWLVDQWFSWPRVATLVARELYGIDGIADPDAIPMDVPAQPGSPSMQASPIQRSA